MSSDINEHYRDSFIETILLLLYYQSVYCVHIDVNENVGFFLCEVVVLRVTTPRPFKAM